MKKIVSLGTKAIMMVLLVACSPATKAIPQATETTRPESPATATTRLEPPATATITQVSPEPIPFLFSKKGPYHVGTRMLSFHDASRDDRYIGITIWYPAVKPADATSSNPTFDAAPDASSAPYPLILSSTKGAKIFAPYLVSHGFVWASVDKIDYYVHMNEEMIDQPLDILFTLNQVASNPPEGLEGMIDSEQVGVIGYSFGGYNTLALSGARIDPEYYLAQCPNPDPTTEPLVNWDDSTFDCIHASSWDEYAAHAGEAITASDDGLWQAMTDERIRAVMPMAGEGWWLFGEKGLAAVDRSVLMIAGTQDVLYPENALIYKHLGSPDKALISFVGDGHMVMITDRDHIARIAHFATAFFGYHLQGRADYAEYFSKDFVAQYEDLAWGVYGK